MIKCRQWQSAGDYKVLMFMSVCKCIYVYVTAMWGKRQSTENDKVREMTTYGNITKSEKWQSTENDKELILMHMYMYM